MSSSALPHSGSPVLGTSESSAVGRDISGFWWLWLVTGVIWIGAAFVVLQFDAASIKTIGILAGCLFMFAAFGQLVEAAFGDSLRWLSAIFAVLLVGAGILSFVNPEKTFAGIADILGFLFLMVGVMWTIEALIARAGNPLWWLGLISGILMLILAFWMSGQFFIEKAYTLLVLTGVWALMKGVIDIVRGFQVRSLRA